MNFKRGLGIVLFIVGVVLLTLGISSAGDMSEKIAKTVEGHYTEATTWHLIIGGVLIVVGGALTLTRRR